MSVDGLLALDGHFLRKVAAICAQRGPHWVVKYTPPWWGVAATALLPGTRRVVRRNLRIIRGERDAVAEVTDVARTLGSYAGYFAEVLSSGSKNSGPPDVVLVGRKHLDRAVLLKKGIIIATIHSGGWELVGPLLAMYRQSELVMVMEGERDERARELQDKIRRESGLSVVHIGEDPLSSLPLLRHLRDEATVALQVDRVPQGVRSIDVKLCGRPFRMPVGPLRLAQVSGAPIVPIFTARTGYRKYLVEAHPAIRVERRASDEQMAAAGQKLADAMSGFLKEHPTQWFHFVG